MVVMLLMSATTSSRALDLQGNARVYRGRTTTQNGLQNDQDFLNQFYNLGLTQNIGPWLGMELGYGRAAAPLVAGREAGLVESAGPS